MQHLHKRNERIFTHSKLIHKYFFISIIQTSAKLQSRFYFYFINKYYLRSMIYKYEGKKIQLTGLVIASISLHNFSIKPHVSNCHSVLCQSSSLIRADSGGGSKGFHSFQVLDQTVLLCHSLGSQC